MDKMAPFNEKLIYLDKRPFGTILRRGMQALITDDEEA